MKVMVYLFSGVEVGHPLWSVWDTYDHAGCDLCQHSSQSGLADWEDARARLHRFFYGNVFLRKVLTSCGCVVMCLHLLSTLLLPPSTTNPPLTPQIYVLSTETWSRRTEMLLWGNSDLVLHEYSLQLIFWLAQIELHRVFAALRDYVSSFTSIVQARGIDVQQVSLVINYDLPANRENYIHRCYYLLVQYFWPIYSPLHFFRIGRGGRFGRKGVAINFITREDERMLKDIEQFYDTQIEEMPMNVADLIWQHLFMHTSDSRVYPCLNIILYLII